MPRWDDQDWVGEPPEGRHTADRADPAFWRHNQARTVGGAAMLLLLIALVLVVLLT